VKLSLEIRFPYPDRKTAEAIASAVAPENGSYVEAELEGSILVCRMSSESPGTLRSTADDLLACIKAAEESAGIASAETTQ
jgi:tRNA threonylcarbamoyladenosine modification (KEOPS) complex  Pcc1 subunit